MYVMIGNLFLLLILFRYFFTLFFFISNFTVVSKHKGITKLFYFRLLDKENFL